tara:strand:+ start:1433 stop:2023 length:591 start_codon:yes stop_codon:yes gene_type:complete
MADLITLETYKDAENITSTKEDVRLTSLVSSVSQLVKTYCGNSIIDFYSSNKTETFNIDFETPFVQLTESPIVSIVSVQERTSYSESYITLTTGAFEFFLDSNTDTIIRTNDTGKHKNFPIGVGAVQVVYKAGYASTPADLELAVIDLIRYYHKDEYKVRQTIAGASIQNSATTSQRDNVGFPDHIKRVLDLYKTY